MRTGVFENHKLCIIHIKIFVLVYSHLHITKQITSKSKSKLVIFSYFKYYNLKNIFIYK